MMADRMPNYQVEIKRIEYEIAALRLNIQRNDLRVLEMKAEIVKLGENSAATEVSIAEYEEKLRRLVDEHGEMEVSDG